MPEFTGQNDLRSYLRVLWRWKFLFLALLIACPLAAYLLERGKPNVYQSSTLVGINQETVNTALLNNANSFSTTNILAIAQLVKTSQVADIAAGYMHPHADPTQISNAVTASGDPTTNFLTITAQAGTPARAAAIANAFAQAIGANQTNSAVQQLNNSIAGIESQLSHMGAKDPNRSGLEQQLGALKASLGSQKGQATVLQSAVPNPTPVGPHLRRTVELGGVIGLLLAFAVVVLAESADRRMRSPDDLEGLTDLPLLASIAPSAFGEALEASPVDEESFQMLRTSLTYFNVDHPLASVLITSPGEKEGKTTVASRLAVAAARAGSRVVLVDADLRRAGVSHRFDLEDHEGLGGVLAGRLSLDDALVEIPVADDPLGTLEVLPAGPPPPNPSALMSSARMQEVLRELEQDVDFVIVDSPAALAVSDSVPLMKSVTGVVLVARMNQSDRATIARLQKIVSSAHGRLLGVVATGVSSGPGYGHYSPSYYSSRAKPARKSRRIGFRRRRRHPEPVHASSTVVLSLARGERSPSGLGED